MGEDFSRGSSIILTLSYRISIHFTWGFPEADSHFVMKSYIPKSAAIVIMS